MQVIAERVGFEPTEISCDIGSLVDCYHRPLGHLSNKYGGGGRDSNLPSPCGLPVFKTGSLPFGAPSINSLGLEQF